LSSIFFDYEITLVNKIEDAIGNVVFKMQNNTLFFDFFGNDALRKIHH
jgi:hypothetical protein